MGSEHTRDSDWSSLICGFFYFIFVCLYHHLKCVKRLVKIYILHPGFDHTSASTVVCNAQYCVLIKPLIPNHILAQVRLYFSGLKEFSS